MPVPAPTVPSFTGPPTALFSDAPESAGPRSFGVLVKVFEDLKAAGRLAEDAEPWKLAEVLWAGLHGIVSLKLTCTGFQGSPVDELTRVLVSTMVHGLPGLKVAKAVRKTR